MKTSALIKFIWLGLALIGVPIVFHYMGVAMEQPADQTGHALAIWGRSLAWCLAAAVLFILGRFVSGVKSYLYGLLFLPLAFLLLPALFFKMNKARVEEIHPGWLGKSGLASDGWAFLMVAVLLAALGCVLILRGRVRD